MKMVLASKNPHKLTELEAILSRLGIEVVLESQVGVDVEVEETGTTFEENAALKATAVMRASGLPAIADDSGLCVTALAGGPGVYSARYGGEGLNDKRADGPKRQICFLYLLCFPQWGQGGGKRGVCRHDRLFPPGSGRFWVRSHLPGA